MEDVINTYGGQGGFLVGQFVFVFFIGLLLTPLISWLVLRRYRGSTRKLMRQRADPDSARPSKSAAIKDPQRPSLRIVMVSGDEAVQKSSKPQSQAAQLAIHDLRSTALVYILAGVFYSLLYAAVYLLTTQAEIQSTTLFSLDNLLLFGLIFFWPTLLILNLIYATSRKDLLLLTGAYFAFLFLGILAEVWFFNAPEIAGNILTIWMLINLLPTILTAWFMQRRLSAAIPLLLPFVLFGCAGSTLMLNIWRFLTGPTAGFDLPSILARLTGLLVATAVAFLLLRLVGRLYQAQYFGDLEYLAMSLFLPFWILQTVYIALDYPFFLFPSFFGLVIYWLILRIGFAFNRRSRDTDQNPLYFLLLRVFALGRRSELFFDSFSKLWRRAGVITMISGPDLVNRLIEPHEFLEFLSGQLSRRFVPRPEELEKRLAQIDIRRDPDGRFRVMEFFCYADTWQMTMRRLAQRSQGILMDLRSFSKGNDGCIFEIETLLKTVDLRQIVFLTDDSTDLDYLQVIIQDRWQAVGPGSPNARRPNPAARIFNLSKKDARQAAPVLLDLLAGAGQR